MTETPPPTFTHLVTGHIIGDAAYRTWRPRGTSDWLLMLTVSGTGRVGGEGDEILANAGDAILLRPGTPHDYGTFPGGHPPMWEIWWTHFHPPADWLTLLDWPEAAQGVLRLSLDADVRAEVMAALQGMHERATGALPRRERFALNALESALLWCDSINGAARRDVRVQKAADWLCRSVPNADLCADDAAALVGLSVSRLSHLFKTQMGMTPTQFLERERITRACRLLEVTGHSVGEVARAVGFADPFYFSNRFKKCTGQSPRAWRAR